MATMYLFRNNKRLKSWFGGTSNVATTGQTTDLVQSIGATGQTAAGSVALAAGDVWIKANALAGYTDTATNAVEDDIVSFLYCLLRRVEDTYNGVEGLLGTDTPTKATDSKPTAFSISRVETTDKAIFTIALPLSKTTSVAAGSLTPT